jgi:hypothetical protein
VSLVRSLLGMRRRKGIGTEGLEFDRVDTSSRGCLDELEGHIRLPVVVHPDLGDDPWRQAIVDWPT